MRKLLRLVASLLLVGALTTAIAEGASADPSRSPGCTTKTFTQKWRAGGVTFYGQERTVRFCWTGGPVLNSKVYGIEGAAYCWSNFPNEDRNCIGPTNRSRLAIKSSTRYSKGNATVYFWFQSRSCAVGVIDAGCSGWKWHGAKYILKQGGGVVLADADV